MTEHRPIDIGILDPATWSTTPSTDGQRADDTGIVSDEAFVIAMAKVEESLVHAIATVDATGTVPMTEVFVDGFVLPDVREIAAAGRGGGNPLIPLLAAIRPQVREPVRDLFHLGATSQDVLDTAMMFVAQVGRSKVRFLAQGVFESLVRLADEHRTTPVAGRTLGQHAAPTTFGLRASVLLDGALRAYRRLLAVELPLQLGGSVGTLAVLVDRLGVDRTEAVRARVAAGLGLAARTGVWHVERTPVVELGTALAAYIGALGRIGMEIAHLASTEIGELEIVVADGEGGSSAMPQKRNPVAAVLLVANARRAPGLAATLLGAQLALDDRPSGDWHAEWQPLRELLRLAIESTALADDALAGLRVNADRMLANIGLSNGAIHAERAQWALVPLVGEVRAAELVRSALEGTDFVPTLLAAVAVEDGIDRSAAADRVREVTTPGGPIGLSEHLIDAAIAAAASL